MEESAPETTVSSILEPRPSHEPSNPEPKKPLNQELKESTAPKLEPISSQPGINSHYELRNTPTMFNSVREHNVIYCIDTSGSMYSALDAVKEHLVETLMQRAHNDAESSFNLIEFSTEIEQWSDEMVRCTPETVAVAMEWIEKLQAKTGTNTLDALMTALSDNACDAVCLVTDGHPDQHPNDILDNVAYVLQNRPVHCIYIHNGQPDELASQFLQELAMESYGSFHVISITNHGCIEKITPVYRAEATAEGIIRTTNGRIYPSNHKICSVTTSLAGPLPDVPYDPFYLQLPPPVYPYYCYPYPFRYYYQLHYPEVGWSRYRASRAGLHHPYFDNGLTIPGAGSTLIGCEVLARRNADGYFYLATVKSQILENKFLVEFKPNKHGKFKTTSYQETYVHDLVSHIDALRHSIHVNDQVLAPFEPEGVRYGPGIVIKGQEKRAAEVGVDEDLVVSFHNGMSTTVPRDTACWVPRELHERIIFELNLPRQVRCEFAENDKFYPEENKPGYPVSGARATPVDYQVYQAGWLEHHKSVPINSGVYNPFYVPHYPVYLRHPPQSSRPSTVAVNQVIPGTGMTREQLNEKIMAQLMSHKMIFEGKKSEEKLLQKREKEENSSSKQMEKSVTFEDVEGDLQRVNSDLQGVDSGRGSSYDQELSDYELDESENESGKETKDKAVGTDHILLRRRTPMRTSEVRPPWRYWNRENAPPLMDPMHEGPYRLGPYEGGLPTMFIDKTHSQGKGVEWSTCMSSFADPRARSRMGYGVADSMYMPKPPSYKPEQQQPGRSVSDILHGNLSEADKLHQYRQDYRRQKTFERENNFKEARENDDRMTALMQDHHRQSIQAQLDRENKRQTDEIQRVQQLREVKKSINGEIRNRIEANQSREQCREQQRINALQARRQRLDDIRNQREIEIERIKAQRLAVKQEKAQERWDRVTQNLDTLDRQESAQLQRAQAAKAYRIQQFHHREDNNLRHRQFLADVNDQRSAIFRSRLFP